MASLLLDDSAKKKVLLASGLQKDLLENISPSNGLTITNFILALKTAVNLRDSYRRSMIQILCSISKFHDNTPFLQMTREDVPSYLDSLRRPEESDPLRKWIGICNLRRMSLSEYLAYHAEWIPLKWKQVMELDEKYAKLLPKWHPKPLTRKSVQLT